MEIIYKLTNNNNGKSYIGQTNNFQKRMNGHKSAAFNKKNHNYYLPLYCSIRKHGWENFSKEILETSPDGLSYEEELEWANEREQYYISLFHAMKTDNGYNISEGGGQSPKGKLTYEQHVALSRFTIEEADDIHQMLIDGINKKDILQKYSDKLTDSYLDNINAGTNLYNPKLDYPLHDYMNDGHSVKYNREEQEVIQKEIISGKDYKDISKKWNLSMGLISLINNGSVWHRDNLEYPLCIKGSSRKHNWELWVQDVIKDLEESDLSLKEIHEKYNKSYSTIKKINEGFSYHDDNKKYPLTKYRKQ